jgi:hypothetical protein
MAARQPGHLQIIQYSLVRINNDLVGGIVVQKTARKHVLWFAVNKPGLKQPVNGLSVDVTPHRIQKVITLPEQCKKRIAYGTP